eukprot:scaffold57080_cov63-Phaeocystis_antarctica.AAC.7
MEFRKCSHMCVCVQSRRLAKPRTTQADRWPLAGQRNAQASRIRSDQMIRFIFVYSTRVPPFLRRPVVVLPPGKLRPNRSIRRRRVAQNAKRAGGPSRRSTSTTCACG